MTPGVLQKASWGEIPLAIYGNIVYVQTAAALHTGEIPGHLDTDPELLCEPKGVW